MEVISKSLNMFSFIIYEDKDVELFIAIEIIKNRFLNKILLFSQILTYHRFCYNLKIWVHITREVTEPKEDNIYLSLDDIFLRGVENIGRYLPNLNHLFLYLPLSSQTRLPI